MEKKEFIARTLNLKDETFVVHIVSLTSSDNVYSSYKTQIASIKIDKTLTTISPEYFNGIDVFSPKLVAKLPEYTEINNHTINLKDGKQPSYRPINSLEPVRFKILKMYIKTNLANGFIMSSKSPTSAPILFIWKLNDCFHLCINY